MNVKVRAGFEVVGMIAVATAVIAGVQAILTYLTKTYGIETMFTAAQFCLLSGAIYFITSVLYDMRVTKLKYQTKLKEMVDQKNK